MEEITAAEARTLSESIDTPERNRILKAIFARIRTAAEHGETEIGMPGHKDETIINHLKSLNFKVTYTDVNNSDPRESSYYTISW